MRKKATSKGWITMDFITGETIYHFKKPVKTDIGWKSGFYSDSVCFLTSKLLKAGECKKVEFIIRVIE